MTERLTPERREELEGLALHWEGDGGAYVAALIRDALAALEEAEGERDFARLPRWKQAWKTLLAATEGERDEGGTE